ncbi:MAG: FAD:protein FMN transferase [Proteobacteria bacterium]|nr:FAD:protein FMN transferase [Pseudomonadota bacterium]
MTALNSQSIKMFRTQLLTRRMGSPFQFTGYVHDKSQELLMIGAFREADAEVARIEDELTDFRASPFERINDAAGKHPVTVSQEIMWLMGQALRICHSSHGAFDISYAATGHLWRKARQTGCLPLAADLASAQKNVNYRWIELDYERSTVFLPRPGMRIGFGGVGKGYAVDRAFNLIKNRCPHSNFMVNGAGDLRVQCETNAKRPWIIRLRNPLGPPSSAAGILTLKSGAVATSGDYERFVMNGGQRLHHIIDGRTGEIRQDIVSVSILAPSALEADLSATAVMALGPVEGMNFIETTPGLRGSLITREGDVRVGKGWSHRSSSMLNLKNLGVFCDAARAST